MAWDKERFDNLSNHIRTCLKGTSPSSGVPFFVYTYDPKEENRAIHQFQQMAKILQGENYRVQTIYLGQVLARILKTLPYLTPAGKQIEYQKRQKLLEELSRVPGGLPERVAEALLTGIDGLFEGLEGGRQDHCAFLLRTGALFPFVHVSQILNYLENKTSWTVVIGFPGSRHPQRGETLRFLNETEGPYYRAVVI